MGLMGKLKNILFEEEEVEIPVIEKKEKPKVEESNKVTYSKDIPRKEEVKETNYNDFYNEEKVTKKVEEKQVQETVSEREIFKSDNTFNFPDFDEEEFKQFSPKRNTPSVQNYERKKVEYKKPEYKKTEYKKPEKKEEERQTKFKPSPIISPVYGILDKNYTPDEITTRNEEIPTKSLDVDSVRKKAFGAMDKTVTEQKIEKAVDEDILEEKLEKARTIDELLKDSSDDYIELNEEVLKEDESVEEVLSLEEEKPLKDEEEDTLENDLFDLIDSMYENREDGE